MKKGKLKSLRLKPENEKHLKSLAKKYQVSEARIVNLFLAKSRDFKNKDNIYSYIEKVLKGGKKK